MYMCTIRVRFDLSRILDNQEIFGFEVTRYNVGTKYGYNGINITRNELVIQGYQRKEIDSPKRYYVNINWNQIEIQMLRYQLIVDIILL